MSPRVLAIAAAVPFLLCGDVITADGVDACFAVTARDLSGSFLLVISAEFMLITALHKAFVQSVLIIWTKTLCFPRKL